MSASQQPDQLPIYPNELHLALDLMNTRWAGYIDNRGDAGSHDASHPRPEGA